MAAVRRMSEHKLSLFLFGDTGTGKTHLVWSIITQLRKEAETKMFAEHRALHTTVKDRAVAECSEGMPSHKKYWTCPTCHGVVCSYDPEGEVKGAVTVEAMVTPRREVVLSAQGMPRFYKVSELLDEIKAGFEKHGSRILEDIMQYEGIIVIDDIGAERMTEWVREQFYRLVDYRYEHQLPTIITSNLDLQRVGAEYGDRIASRITGMCGKENILKIAGKDRRF